MTKAKKAVCDTPHVGKFVIECRIVDSPTSVNGHLPVLGGESSNDDGAQPKHGRSELDDRTRQQKLAALRKFFADVHAEVARLANANKRKGDGTTSSLH